MARSKSHLRIGCAKGFSQEGSQGEAAWDRVLSVATALRRRRPSVPAGRVVLEVGEEQLPIGLGERPVGDETGLLGPSRCVESHCQSLPTPETECTRSPVTTWAGVHSLSALGRFAPICLAVARCAPGAGADLLGELRAALLRASEEKAVEKLKQVLACVVDTIVVEGRDHIQPYYFVPGVLTVFPSRRPTVTMSNISEQHGRVLSLRNATR